MGRTDAALACAHQRVLDAAGEGGVLLPIRFASISSDDSAVTTALAERADHLLERLRVLEGKTECNPKASHDEEAVLRLVVTDNDETLSSVTQCRRVGAIGDFLLGGMSDRAMRSSRHLLDCPACHDLGHRARALTLSLPGRDLRANVRKVLGWFALALVFDVLHVALAAVALFGSITGPHRLEGLEQIVA
ncbi:GvpL/GvpF family gas vesicle protein [Streptomyces paradoxus]|uniref:GvpL/GvpF family gas vesicle protein n=1 Tax=Streptomyces paradoxus TaxID=66375 RepID=UPI003702C3D0